jgi:hypothetical protein
MKVAVPDTLLLFGSNAVLIFLYHRTTICFTPNNNGYNIAIDKIFFITLRFSLFYKVTIN